MFSRIRSKVADESGFLLVGGFLGLVLYVVVFLVFINNWAASPVPGGNDNFIYGLLQGIFAAPAFIVSLFDPKIAIYQVGNIGGWYDFGFLVGIGAIFGGASNAS